MEALSHYMMIKGSTHKEDMTSQTWYATNNKNSKYLQKMFKESQGKIEKDSRHNGIYLKSSLGNW